MHSGCRRLVFADPVLGMAAASSVAAAAMSGRPRRKGEATANRSIVAAGQYTLTHGPATLRHVPLQEPHSQARCQVRAIGMCKPSEKIAANPFPRRFLKRF